MTQSYERSVVFCPHCKYSTNRNFNLKRHLDSKHVDILLNQAFLLNLVPNVPPGVPNVPSKIQNVSPEEISDHVNKNDFIESVENVNEISVLNQELHDNDNNVTTCNKSICNKRSKFKCPKCSKEYNTKRHFMNHETKCTGVDSLTCPKCMISFTSRQHKNKHIKANKCKPRSIIYARIPLHKTQESMNKTDSNQDFIISSGHHIDSQTNNINKLTNINQQTNNNQCTQITQNIHIHNYGSERTDYLDYEKYLQIFKKCYDIPSAMTKEIHFNIEFPENNNILYNNERTALVKTDDKFMYKDLHILVEELIKDKSRLVQEFARENKEHLCNSLSHELYEQIIDLLLKLVLIKEPSAVYKKQVNMIIDMVRNTRLQTKEIINRS